MPNRKPDTKEKLRKVSFSTNWGIVSFMTDKPTPKLSAKKKEEVGQLAFADKVIDMTLKGLDRKGVLILNKTLATERLAEWLREYWYAARNYKGAPIWEEEAEVVKDTYRKEAAAAIRAMEGKR